MEGVVLVIEFNSAVHIIPDTWEEFKKYIDGTYKKLRLQYTDDDEGYDCFVLDNDILVSYRLWDYGIEKPGLDTVQNNTDVTDFIDNYKNESNKELVVYNVLNDAGGFSHCKCRSIERTFTFQTTIGVNPTIVPLTFGYKIGLLCGFTLGNWNDLEAGDTFSVHLYPTANNGIIGQVTQESVSGQNIVYVDSNVINYTYPGDYVMLGTEDYIYEVNTIGTDNIVLAENLNETKNVDDYVKLRVVYIKDRPILANAVQYIGDRTFGSAVIDSDKTIEVHYNHVTTPVSVWSFNLTLVYYHGVF